ncbi:MAG: PLDc N-terminal domain-containing protein [Actinomycetota bacterium]
MESIIAMLAATFGTFFFAIITFAIIISSIISLGLFALWIITLIDCIQRDEKDFAVGGSNAKLLWILLLVLVSNIVPLIYYFLIMYKKPRTGSKKSDNTLESKK